MTRALLAGLLGCCLLGCSSDLPSRTEIAITVDSDLKVPSEIDWLTIDVTRLVSRQQATADLTKIGLPRSLTLVHDSGPVGPILVIARGWRDTQKIVESKVEVSFQIRTTVELNIELQSECEQIFCDDDQTCRDGECRAIPRIDPRKPDAGSKFESDAGSDGDPIDMPKPDSGLPNGKPDAGPQVDAGPLPNRPPTCAIMSPEPFQSFLTDEEITLTGRCTDPESGTLSGDLLHWTDDDGTDLGSGSSLPLGTRQPSMPTFQLCAADPDDAALSDCAEVTIVVAEPGPPTAEIRDVLQGGDDAPFNADEEISLTGVGTGVGITYAWSDSFIGEFGDETTASIASPEVGRHRVTFTVTDETDVTAEDTETFVVLPAGQSTLVQPFNDVNDTLDEGADAIAVDSVSQVLAARGASLYRFDGSDIGADESAAITGAATPAITAINQIFISQDLVYLATTNGLVVCDYEVGMAIDGTSCDTFNAGNFPSNNVTAVTRGTIDDVDTLVVGTDNGLFVPNDVRGSSTGIPLTGLSTAGQNINGIVQGVALYQNVQKPVFWFTCPESDLGVYWPFDGHVSSRGDGDDNRAQNAVAKTASEVVWVASNEAVERYIEPVATGAPGGWREWKVGTAIPGGGPGLPSNDIFTVATTRATFGSDTHDMVWIGSNSGLTRFDPDVAVEDPNVTQPSFMTLTTVDGLPSNGVLAIAVMPNGDKLISTDAGLALYTGR